MKKIILEVLARVGCPETGSQCQVNLQSEGAREMLAVALEKELEKYTNELLEIVVTGIQPKK